MLVFNYENDFIPFCYYIMQSRLVDSSPNLCHMFFAFKYRVYGVLKSNIVDPKRQLETQARQL